MTAVLCERKECVHCDMRSKTCEAEQIEIGPQTGECLTREEVSDASKILPMS